MELFAGREHAFRDSTQRLKQLAAEEGLEYGERTHTYNSRLAQELAVAGDMAGVTDAMHDALYRAYFVAGRNLASPEVLIGLAEEAGLDAELARETVEGRRYQTTIDEHWQRALGVGVRGVPTFAVGRAAVVGAQPWEVLVDLMEHAGVVRRES